MAEREVAWGDDEIVSVPVVKTTSVTPSKKEKEPLPTPEWSIDTRGDLPMDQAVSASAAPVAAEFVIKASAPSWPEEDSSYDPAITKYNSVPMNEMPPSTRRIGRDSVPRSGDRNERGGDRSARNERGGDRPRGDRPTRGRLDDFSTLNLPGVDLNKMPQATTRLSFSNGRNGGDDRGNRPRREECREDSAYENVDRVIKEVEKLGWDDNTEVPAAPVETSRTKSLNWVDEIEVFEPVKAAKPVCKAQAAAAPVKINNTNARLEEDGWGDEPEEFHVPVARLNRAEPSKVSEPELVKSVDPIGIAGQVEPIVVPVCDLDTIIAAAAPVSVSDTISAAAAPVSVSDTISAAAAPVSVSAAINAAAFTSSEQLSVPQPHPMMMSPYAAQIPYMMNPMSPVGQMPMPMSMMPGMMMPIWVTCPFCYHCYMYPPVAPGSGPAPGATHFAPYVNSSQQN